MIRRWSLRVLTVALIAISVIAGIARVAEDGERGVLRLAFSGTVAIYLGTGLLLMERRPGHRLGPIVYALGVLVAYYLLADAVITMPGTDLDGIVATTVSLLDGAFFFLIAMLFLSFPDGHLPSPRWRKVVIVDLVLLPIVLVGTMVRPGRFAYYPAIENPFGSQGQSMTTLADVAYVLMIVVVGLSALSLVGRWRRGNVIEQAQIKWVALAAVAIATVMLSYGAIAGPGGYSELADGILSIVLGVFPVTIGIAILRYHLFEIDRIVSRSIAYALITALLVATYAVVILTLQGPLASFTGGDTIAVALSTLVVAGAFQPVRRRVQSLVDRRFDRARFDAERTSAAFAERLRAEVDIESVSAELRRTVGTSLRPAGLGLWLRESGR